VTGEDVEGAAEEKKERIQAAKEAKEAEEEAAREAAAAAAENPVEEDADEWQLHLGLFKSIYT